MILKHVHLFGILLLSFILASFLGRFLDINKEGLDTGNTDPPNRHTGGGIPQFQPPPPPPHDPDATETDAVPENEPDDTSNDYGNGIEPFIAPITPFNFNLKEGLTSGDSGDSDGRQTGIPADQIPPGQGHLYVLKSQVVPPTTCPVCPQPNSGTGGEGGGRNNMLDSSSGLSNGLGSAFDGGGGNGFNNSNSGGSKCPPCPACARCPEQSFECKKVPNYSVGQNGAMSVPRPVLADFSQFGM